MSRLRTAATLATAAAVLLISLGSSTPATAQAETRGWLALGDSYSSGEGIPGTKDVDEATTHQGRDCKRATGDGTKATAWSVSAHRAAGERLGVGTLALVACTGATTSELATQISEAGARHRRDRWDLVTFSIGGNDIGFADILKGCLDADNLPWSAFDVSPGCDVDKAELRRRVDELRGTLSSVYDDVASRVNPGGDVIVLGYPHLVEEFKRWDPWRREVIGNCEGIQSWDVDLLRGATGYLNQQIALAVADANARHAANGVEFRFLDISLDPYEYSDDAGSRHALCSPDPWLNGQTTGVKSGDWRIERSFHPTQVGHDNTGRVLATLLDTIRLDDPPQAECSVESITVAVRALSPVSDARCSGDWAAARRTDIDNGETLLRKDDGVWVEVGRPGDPFSSCSWMAFGLDRAAAFALEDGTENYPRDGVCDPDGPFLLQGCWDLGELGACFGNAGEPPRYEAEGYVYLTTNDVDYCLGTFAFAESVSPTSISWDCPEHANRGSGSFSFSGDDLVLTMSDGRTLRGTYLGPQ